MSTPAIPILQGLAEHVEPAAIAGPQASAVFKVGQVLKELIHAVPSAFPGENDVLRAVNDVESFISAFVKKNELPALATGDQRAMVEDVSKRPTPAGVAFSTPMAQAGIDYDRLAAAIVRQMAEQTAVTPPAPAAEQTTETPGE
ncbi:MAG TPA: hypothetical protein VGR89_00485 [Puia sp.]|nr:hypothetical protein [Puia sp.]